MIDYFTTQGGLFLLAPLEVLFNPTNRGYYLFLLSSVLIAVCLHIREIRATHSTAKERSAALEHALFPKEVYTHRSSKVDYFYFIANTILYSTILAPVFLFMSRSSYFMESWLVEMFGPSEATGEATLTTKIIYTAVVLLLADFALYVSHVLSHKVPFFWEFHKVHHSAEVMTPVTVYRMHPVDDIVAILFSATFTGIFAALFRYHLTPSIGIVAIQGLNIGLFLFYISAYHLRHSHIWLSYGPHLSKIFISPAQHQIHHSTQRKHWDRNFGFIFSFWDLFFNSIYVPKEKENIQFGIGNGFEDREYSSVLRLYFLPFKKAFDLYRPKKPTQDRTTPGGVTGGVTGGGATESDVRPSSPETSVASSTPEQ